VRLNGGETVRLKIRRALALALGVAVLVGGSLLLAACGSSSSSGSSSQPAGSGTSSTTGASSQSSSGGSGPPVRVIMIGGSPSDPFWSAVVRGGQDAAADRGVSFDFLGPDNYNNLGPDLARLEETALAKHPSIVVSGNFIPTAQSPGLKAIARAGIPLIEYNTGDATWRSDGAIRYVGTDEHAAGVAAGQAFVKAGDKNVVCFNSVPGNPGVEARCAGVKEAVTATGVKYTEFELPATQFGDPSSTTEAIKGALIKDPSIDGIATTAANVADYAFKAIGSAGRSGKVTLGTFDVNLANLQRIQQGQQLFAVDQEPYLQGYMAVSMAFLYIKWGLLPTTDWLKTGPLVITKDNVAPVIAGAKAGVRGAS
jgi:simple sugar transport system substrate-binding protein